MENARIKVKRDGPRGWHWIAAASFDPARHEIWTEPGQAAPPAPQTATTAETAPESSSSSSAEEAPPEADQAPAPAPAAAPAPTPPASHRRGTAQPTDTPKEA